MKSTVRTLGLLLLVTIILFVVIYVGATPPAPLMTFVSPAVPPPTPTPGHFVYEPLIMNNYDLVTPTPGPTPRPTLPPSGCPPVWIDGVTYISSLGSGQWNMRKVLSCGGGGFGICFYYHDGEYLGYGVSVVEYQLPCSENASGTIAVYRECPYSETEPWLYKELPYTNYPPSPCP